MQNALTVRRIDGVVCTVVAAPDAYITRGVDGVQPDVSAFVAGEDIVWRGEVTAERSLATELQSLYQGRLWGCGECAAGTDCFSGPWACSEAWWTGNAC
jgi:hypothetical protein